MHPFLYYIILLCHILISQMQLELRICTWVLGHHHLGHGQCSSGQSFPIVTFCPKQPSVFNNFLGRGGTPAASTPIHATVFNLFHHLLILWGNYGYYEFICVTDIQYPESSISWHFSHFWPFSCFFPLPQCSLGIWGMDLLSMSSYIYSWSL